MRGFDRTSIFFKVFGGGHLVGGGGFLGDATSFADNWKFPAYSGVFLLTVDNFSFFVYSCSFFAYNFSFLLTVGPFLFLMRALRDCKQRNLTVSKKLQQQVKKLPPFSFAIFEEFLVWEIWISCAGALNCKATPG